MKRIAHGNPWVAGLAALGISSLVSMARAEENAPAGTTSTNQPPEAVAAPPPGLLLTALGGAGVAAPLTNAGIYLYGYAEAGFFHDFSAPGASAGPTYIQYNNFKDEGILDKISLNLERPVDPTQNKFDVGFHAEGIYGADAAFIHSNGLLDSQSGRNQWDLVQGYLDVTLPDLPVRLRVGKFDGVAGFEQLSCNIFGAFGDPARALYTYSYQFLYAEPTTETGFLVTYVPNARWTFAAGFTMGWNQSANNSKNALDFLGSATYTPNDQTSLTFVMTEGPEFPTTYGANQPRGDDHDYWTALDLVLTRKINDKLSLGLGGDYVETPHIPGYHGVDKQWGGVAGYASYAFDPRYTLNTRWEWYNDSADGYSTGASSSANYYAATVGVAIKPFPNHKILGNLLLRPEIRYDYADQPVFASGEHNQVTFSVDALFIF